MRMAWTAALIAAITLGGTHTACAQAQQVITSEGSYIIPAPATLALPPLLEKLDWDPAERGPLLIVAPEKAIPGRRSDPNRPEGMPDYIFPLRPEDAPPPGERGYHAFALEKLFDRKLMKAGGLSVIAPRYMHVLNWNHLPAPDPTTGLSRAARRRLLEASLTDAQWQRLGSSQGLGLEDLMGEQARLFRSMLPEQIIVNTLQRDTAGGFGQERTRRLTATERAGIRLLVRRKLTWSLPTADGNYLSFGGDIPASSVSAVPRDFDRSVPFPGVLFGVTVREAVPNALKASDLSYRSSALDAPVSLTGVKTVGGLIERCARATRLGLMADPRYAPLAVLARGDAARAGDVLEALALGVTGAFRRVGDTWLLTDDRVPLGVRIVHIGEWIDQNISLRAAHNLDIAQRRGQKRLRFAGWMDGDPRRLDPALESRIVDGKEPGDPVRTPIRQLPDAVQEVIRKQIEQSQRRAPEARPTGDDALVTIETETMLIVPGIGPVPSDILGGRERGSDWGIRTGFQPPPAPPSQPLPHTTPTSILLRARTPQDAAALVTRAKVQGFDALWLEPVGEMEPILKAAIAASKRAGIPISAVLRLSRARPGDTDLDPTVLGETPTRWARRHRGAAGEEIPAADWNRRAQRDHASQIERLGDFVRIDQPDQRRLLVERFRRIAALPGLAGVVVRDLAPVGYQSFRPYEPSYDFTTGFADPVRLETIRRGGGDPADLCQRPLNLFAALAMSDTEDGQDYPDRPGDLTLPYFPEQGRAIGSAPWSVWDRVRADSARELLTALRGAGAQIPVLFEADGWFGSFDRAPEAKVPGPDVEGLAALRRVVDGTSTLAIGHRPLFPPDLIAESLEIRIRRGIGALRTAPVPALFSGIVYDLMDAPDAQQLTALNLVRVEKP